MMLTFDVFTPVNDASIISLKILFKLANAWRYLEGLDTFPFMHLVISMGSSSAIGVVQSHACACEMEQKFVEYVMPLQIDT